uniref:LOB domain-containing protein n=1 Tax=Setaria italica TaxID=4555 RepID=K4AEN9_SETIT
MSCNGCRVLRKGCSEGCVLRPCLQWIDAADAQGHATVFVAKFFGRAGLLSFISAVPDAQRPVAAVRGGGAYHQPGPRRGGAAGDGELAPLPGRRRHRAAWRRHRPAAGARQGHRRERRPLRPGLRSQARRRMVHLLHGEAGAEGRQRRAARRGGALRPRAVPEPRVPAGAGGAEGPAPAAGHAVHELGRVRDHHHDRRRQGAGAAQPFSLSLTRPQLILIHACARAWVP